MVGDLAGHSVDDLSDRITGELRRVLGEDRDG